MRVQLLRMDIECDYQTEELSGVSVINTYVTTPAVKTRSLVTLTNSSNEGT